MQSLHILILCSDVYPYRKAQDLYDYAATVFFAVLLKSQLAASSKTFKMFLDYSFLNLRLYPVPVQEFKVWSSYFMLMNKAAYLEEKIFIMVDNAWQSLGSNILI